MAKLAPYHGTYVSAESASTKIDLDAILAGCDHVDQEASKISEFTNTIKDSTSNLDIENFSIDNKTVQPMIDDCCSNCQNTEEEIFNTTANIRASAEAKYNEIQQELNRIAEEKDKALISQNR